MDFPNIVIQDTHSLSGVDADITIKEEFNPHTEEILDVKTEAEEIQEHIPETEQVLDNDDLLTSFRENDVNIKEEFTVRIEDDSQNSVEVSQIKKEMETEIIVPTTLDNVMVKVESMHQDSISYDYPSFDDSFDSREATALSHVEACLSDNVNVKIEDNAFELPEKNMASIIKEESELTVTETHLISNKFINTTSTITSTQDGFIESNTTNTFIMEIHPMTDENQSLKMNPEEILPTIDSTSLHMDCDSFQLNSITGDVLSLEQEAFGLLQTSKSKDTTCAEVICPKCPKIYNSKYPHYNLKRHLKVHETIENRANGVLKGKQTRIKNQAMKMKETEEILPTTEDDCQDSDFESFQFNSITGDELSLEQEALELLETTNSKATTGLECPKCPKICNSKYLLKCHLKVHKFIENRTNGILKGVKTKLKKKQDKQSNMEVASEGEESLEEENEDVKKEEKEGYRCTCGATFRRRIRMETCLRSHTDYSESSTYDCPSCDQKFNSKDSLSFHRKRHHRKKFPCKFCPTDYHTQKGLFKHLQIHQQVQLTEYKVISEEAEGKRALRCLLCDTSYSDLAEFKTHIMEGHSEPYQCPRCTETFPKLAEFATHVKSAHADAGEQSILDLVEAYSKLMKAWKCGSCGLQCREADKLALHQLQQHSGEPRADQTHACDHCHRLFLTRSGLHSHMRIHHRTETDKDKQPKVDGVLCLECRKVCPDMAALTSHMRLHSPDRKYPCKYCDFRFATPQKRKKHAEVHTGDMKYVCFICEYTCSSENRLKQHKMSVKHANMREYLLTGKPLLEEEQSTSNTQKIKDTLRKKEWGVKKKKKRDKDGDFACDVCGETFHSDDEMQEHKQSHPFIEFPNEDKPTRIFFK